MIPLQLPKDNWHSIVQYGSMERVIWIELNVGW